MNRRLVHDAAMRLTRELVGEIGWTTDEDVERGFLTLLPVVERGLIHYEVVRARLARRLAKPEEVRGEESEPF